MKCEGCEISFDRKNPPPYMMCHIIGNKVAVLDCIPKGAYREEYLDLINEKKLDALQEEVNDEFGDEGVW